jgi:hypothetical protein
LAAVARLPPASTLRSVLFAAIGAVSLGVIFGAGNPFAQPLGAAAAAGIVGAAAVRFDLSDAQGLIAICPCMVLVPGPTF